MGSAVAELRGQAIDEDLQVADSEEAFLSDSRQVSRSLISLVAHDCSCLKGKSTKYLVPVAPQA